MRLMHPASKKRTFEHKDWLLHFPSGTIDLHQIYRSLSFFGQQKEALEQHLNKQIAEMVDHDISVCFFDVTTYYFESQQADDLKRFGFSKDNKVNQVQVVMGLLIDSYGIPIGYNLYPGNTNEFGTLEPVLKQLKDQYGIQKLIITADRGLNSKVNLAKIRRLGFDYVLAYKIRTASKEVKSLVLDDSGYRQLSKDLKVKATTLSQEVRLEGQTYELTDTFVLTYSKKRAQKDRKDRQRLIEKAITLSQSPAKMKSELKKGGKKYVQLALDNVDLEVDQPKIEDDERFDGYYGIVCSDRTLEASEIIDIYQGLWKIEESFRVSKSNLEARPLFVWTPESIQGHFVICYLALTLQRVLEYQLKLQGLTLSTERIQKAINSAVVSLIEQKTGSDYYIKNEPNSDFKAILSALKLAELPMVGRVTQIKW